MGFEVGMHVDFHVSLEGVGFKVGLEENPSHLKVIPEKVSKAYTAT